MINLLPCFPKDFFESSIGFPTLNVTRQLNRFAITTPEFGSELRSFRPVTERWREEMLARTTYAIVALNYLRPSRVKKKKKKLSDI